MNKISNKNWQIKSLKDVSNKLSLNKLKIKQKEYLINGLFPVIDQGQDLIGGYYNDKNLLVSDEPPYIIFGDHTKIKKFITFKFIPGADGVKVLKAKENILPKFLYYLLFTIKIEDKGYARHFQLLEKENFLIPNDLETQQAIVSKIEELFSELDKGIEDLKTAQQQLKTYRQGVLNLLATNENLMPIEKLIDKLDQGWSPKCENQASVDKNQWAVIKTSAIQQGYFVEIENKILPTNLSPKEQHEIQIGDILITRAGPRVRVGICCMVRHTRPKLINCDKVYRIKVNKKIIIPEYFEYIINTPKYQDIIEKMKSGISDSGLNLTQKVFVQIEIPVPTIEEQHYVVQEIESRLSVADKMEESIAHSLLQAESLRQSILKKAFSGELV